MQQGQDNINNLCFIYLLYVLISTRRLGLQDTQKSKSQNYIIKINGLI